MDFSEIKKNMTQEKWGCRQGPKPQWYIVEAGTEWSLIANTLHGNDKANAYAIATAVNATYGKEIDPEGVLGLLNVAVRIEREIHVMGNKRWPDSSITRDLIKALAAAQPKD